jgi:uncharacterized membrane protein YhaH (DUF805 family)
MGPLALFFCTVGRLTPKAFWLSLLAVYLASLTTLLLLTGAVTKTAGLWPFAVAQLAVLWAWTVVHMKRLRDAGRAPSGAFAVALLYGLAIGLVLLLVVTVDTGTPPAVAGQEPHSGLALALLVGFLVFLINPNLGSYSYILQALALIACLPFVLSLTFSLATGLRRGVS